MNTLKNHQIAGAALVALCLVFCLGCPSNARTGDGRSEVASSSENADQATEESTAAKPDNEKKPPVSEEDLRMAAYQGQLAMVKQALNSGTNVNAADSELKLTPLHMAAYNGHTAVVALLLSSGAEVDAIDHEGKTALTHACTGPFQDSVTLLVESGANINIQESTEGFTPLMMAAGLGQTDVVRILLEHGADRSIRDADNDLAIDHARNSGHQQIVDLLSQ